jgi:hypothetical protein
MKGNSMKNKTIASVAAISLMATFMSGCAGLPKPQTNDDSKKTCRPTDTFLECCEKRELEKKKDKKVYYSTGSCPREGGDNDRNTPTTDKPDIPDKPDSEPPSDQPRDNPDHDHDKDKDKDKDRDGGPGQGKGDHDKGDHDKGGHDKGGHDKGGHDKDKDRDGGPGQGRDHAAIKIKGPAFA